MTFQVGDLVVIRSRSPQLQEWDGLVCVVLHEDEVYSWTHLWPTAPRPDEFVYQPFYWETPDLVEFDS